MAIKKTNLLDQFGDAIGVGIVAGLVGTVAITLSQLIEMKITKREPSTAPAEAVSKVLDVQPASEEAKQKVSQEVHWAYGTSWGIVRGLVSLTGLKGWPATIAHFAAIWGTSMVMMPALKLAPPVTEEDPKTIAIDGVHHAVYAVATGLIFDAIRRE